MLDYKMSETPDKVAQTPPAAKPPEAKPFEVAVLPLQNTTLFPETIVPLAVGRPRSVAAVESALATEEKLIACVTARPDAVTGTDAKPSDLYEVGHSNHRHAAEHGRHRSLALAINPVADADRTPEQGGEKKVGVE